MNTSNGDYLPICKYDARAGRFFRVDRTQGAEGEWRSDHVDITDQAAFLADMHHVEVGWIGFPGGRPDFKLVQIGDPLPEQPDAVDEKGRKIYQGGFRILIKLSQDCGGDLRHFSHGARSVVGAFDALHDVWLAAPEHVDPDKVPIIKLAGTAQVKHQTSQGATTNYAPVFEIVGWTEYPVEFTEYGPQPVAATTTTTSEPGETDDSDIPF